MHWLIGNAPLAALSDANPAWHVARRFFDDPGSFTFGTAPGGLATTPVTVFTAYSTFTGAATRRQQIPVAAVLPGAVGCHPVDGAAFVATLGVVTPGIPVASAATTCPAVFFVGVRARASPLGSELSSATPTTGSRLRWVG